MNTKAEPSPSSPSLARECCTAADENPLTCRKIYIIKAIIFSHSPPPL